MQKSVFKLFPIALLLWLILGLSSLSMGQKGQLVDKIIAKVNNYIVLESDLQRKYLDIITHSWYIWNIYWIHFVTYCEFYLFDVCVAIEI